MRSQKLVTRRWYIIFAVGITFLPMSMPVIAQMRRNPPQFLFRDGDRLVLVNGETGDAVELPDIEVEATDRYEWSPNGEYLLALQSSENYPRCLNLYDVDAQEWLYAEPIACNVEDATFSHDDTQLAYAISDGFNSTLRLQVLENAKTTELFQTTEGDQYFPVGITDIRWSSLDAYLTFTSYKEIMGGPINTLVVRNIDTGIEYTITGGRSGYYALYDPIWSESEEWFLLRLQEEYVTSGALGVTNHRGDLYLVRPTDGELYRLTYTPAEEETNIGWTPNGNITFDTVQHVMLSVEEAVNVQEPPPELLITPEPIDPAAYAFSTGYRAPGEDFLLAWVIQGGSSERGSFTDLNIGSHPVLPDNIIFTAPLPENYRHTNVIIGWRP